MALLVLDDDGNRRGPLDLEVEQRLSAGKQVADVALDDLKRSRLLTAAVDHAGHKALAAHAAAVARAERLPRCSLELFALSGHRAREDKHAATPSPDMLV